MKKLTYIFTLLSVLFILTTNAQADHHFEGTLDMKINIAEKGKAKSAQNMSFTIKGPKGFVEISDASGNAQGSMLWNTEKDEIITLVDQNGQKMALKSTLTMWKSISKSMSSMVSDFDFDNEEDPFTWEKSRETKAINGVNCVKYNGSNSKYKMEAWVAEDQKMPVNAFAPFMEIFPAMQGIHGFGQGMLKQSRIEAKDKSSVVEINNTFQRKSISDSKFEVPADYPVMDITRMLQQLGNMDEKTSQQFLEQMFRGGR